ncbi:hypothetical protein M440DRAFT_1405897 [Trichoderma longibrachiatum ATCC 18648]|uniref:Uncharacterized protein n=1 Tax=Trichoderma longibrachiatum ATCC 18648 TaxID=983965 RepID=A0A2T4BS72_TRILO|nr:hypothetical protein M440DRAFT_1405897 [Trichoderma longibrachiatum ATCC 18648]
MTIDWLPVTVWTMAVKVLISPGFICPQLRRWWRRRGAVSASRRWLDIEAMHP